MYLPPVLFACNVEVDKDDEGSLRALLLVSCSIEQKTRARTNKATFLPLQQKNGKCVCSSAPATIARAIDVGAWQVLFTVV